MGCRPGRPGFLPGLLFKVQSFGLILTTSEEKGPASLCIKQNFSRNWTRKLIKPLVDARLMFPSISGRRPDWYLKDVWITNKFKSLVCKQKFMLYFYDKNILNILHLYLNHFLSLLCSTRLFKIKFVSVIKTYFFILMEKKKKKKKKKKK